MTKAQKQLRCRDSLAAVAAGQRPTVEKRDMELYGVILIETVAFIVVSAIFVLPTRRDEDWIDAADRRSKWILGYSCLTLAVTLLEYVL